MATTVYCNQRNVKTGEKKDVERLVSPKGMQVTAETLKRFRRIFEKNSYWWHRHKKRKNHK